MSSVILDVEFPDACRRRREALWRMLDATVAFSLLIIVAPAMVAIALAIVVDSPGGVFYGQQRVGAGGRIFTMWKFRSMRADALGPQVTAASDPRVTRVGRVLRRSSLDELPQLWCVLTGKMALVGPRPETPALAVRYPDHCRAIFAHRPGMTGPAQLRFRDHTLVPAGDVDVETWYVTVVAPAKVACDLALLGDHTVRIWARTMCDTARHLTGRPIREVVTDGHVDSPSVKGRFRRR